MMNEFKCPVCDSINIKIENEILTCLNPNCRAQYEIKEIIKYADRPERMFSVRKKQEIRETYFRQKLEYLLNKINSHLPIR